MTNLKFDRATTVLLVIGPYKDFISAGGKVWNRLKAVAEAKDRVPNMLCGEFSLISLRTRNPGHIKLLGLFSFQNFANLFPEVWRRKRLLNEGHFLAKNAVVHYSILGVA